MNRTLSRTEYKLKVEDDEVNIEDKNMHVEHDEVNFEHGAA